jgi:hypothetical protein
MTMKAGLIALALAGCAALPSMAQEAAGDGEAQGGPAYDPVIVQKVWSAYETCSEANATAVTLDDLVRDKPKWMGKCVSTVGFLAMRALFPQSRDLNERYPWGPGRHSAGRVGLYFGSNDTMHDVMTTDSTRARIVGIAWDCSGLWPPESIVIGGYCHYSAGPIIGVSSFHPLR